MNLLNRGVGKDLAGPFFPPHTPPKCYFLSTYLYVYTTLSLYLSSNDYLSMSTRNPSLQIAYFTKCLANGFFKIVGWGKTRPAHSFLLHYFLTFQFICQSFGLNSNTVSEHSLWIIGTSTLLGRKDWAGPFFPSSKMY